MRARSILRTTALIGIAGFFAISVVAFYPSFGPMRGWLTFYAWCVFSGAAHGGNLAIVNDVSIYYETYGAGSPVLILHGGLGSHEGMRNQIRALSRNHLVVAPDSRGQGRSSDTPARLTYSVMADDMVQLLDHLQIAKVDVVGWSDGGIIGLDLAMRYPERINRLVAISANYDPRGISEDPETNVDIPRAPIRYLLTAKDPAYWPVLYRKVTEMWRTEPKYSVADLGHIKAPTLIMAGEFDTIKREHTTQLTEAISGSQKVIVEGAPHSVPTSKPDIVNKIILNFLDGSP